MKKMRTILDLRSITNCKHPAVPIRLGSEPFIPSWLLWRAPDFDLERVFVCLLFVAQFLLSDHLVAAGRLVVVVGSAAAAVAVA